MKRLCAASRTLVVSVLSLSVVIVAKAEPPKGVTPTVIGRATFDAFDLKSDPLAFSAQAKGPVDIIVRTHDYAPGSSTGWHSHPGPVFIQVIEGQVTFYERDDPTCTPKVVSKGQAYVDTGKGHIGRNETGAPAKDVAVIYAPVGKPFRAELEAPAPQCKF
jgi:quercetin dioxygenase-like cupin family protein